jgi:hypothetical protein
VQEGYFSSAWPFNLLLHVFFNCLSCIWHPLMWYKQTGSRQQNSQPVMGEMKSGFDDSKMWKGGHEATHNLWRLKCRDKFLPTWDISHFVV